MSLSGGIDATFAAAPELVDTPGMALDSAQSLDPTSFAPVLSHAANVQAAAQAAGASDAGTEGDGSTGSGGGFFGTIGNFFQHIPGVKTSEHLLGGAVHVLSAPLREVQRDYRYVHMVWTKNGPVAGLLTTVGVLAGGALGAYLGGSAQSAALGAEGAAALERQLSEAFGGHGAGDPKGKDEGLARTADLSGDPNVKISIGRDLAHGLGLGGTDKGLGKFVSGASDAAFDWTSDPVIIAAKLKTGLKLGELGQVPKAAAAARIAAGSAEGIKGAKTLTAIRSVFNGDILRAMQKDGAAQFIDRVAPGVQVRLANGTSLAANSEQLNNLYNASVAGHGYRGFLKFAAENDSAAIVSHYPELQDLVPNVLKSSDGTTTLKGLGSASTMDEAHQVLVNVLENANFSDRLTNLSVAPTRTLTRALGQNVGDKLLSLNSQPVSETSGIHVAVAKAIGHVASGNLGEAGATLKGALGQKVRSFSGYQPFALDTHLLSISGKTFELDPVTQQMSPLAGRGLLNMGRFSMGEQRSKYWVDQMLNAPTLGEQNRIYGEMHTEMAKAAGFPDDPIALDALRRKAADTISGPMAEPTQAFGFGKDFGRDVDLQPSGDTDAPGALFPYQHNNTLTFADFKEMKQAMRIMRGSAAENYGRVDEMINAKYTGRIFKPMALMNAGFALRVAFAEAIPQAMRVGAMQHLRDTVLTRATRAQYALLKDEPDHILAAAANALSGGAGLPRFSSGVNKLLNDPLARQRALDLIIRHEGHIAQGVARTGESTGGWMDQDPSDKNPQAVYHTKSELKNQPQLRHIETGSFDYYAPGHDNFDGSWQGQLSRMATQTQVHLIAQDLKAGGKDFATQQEAGRIEAATSGHPDALPAYVREDKSSSGFGNVRAQNWSPQDYAARRVDFVRGVTEGADDTVHGHLLDRLAAGDRPTLEDIQDIPHASRPAQVYGPVTAPYLGPKLLDRIVKYGFTKVVDPVINGLSRDPMFFRSFSDEMDKLQGAVDSGHLSEDLAHRIAETRAVTTMIPKIHNTALRNQFSVLSRNYMPFYFAQEQALKRAGKLIATNPEAIRQYQMLEHGLSDPGFVQKDDQGNSYFMFPGVGFLQGGANAMMGLFGDQVVSGLPLTVKGSMQSVNTVLPELQMPGVSPMMSIPLNKLTTLFPELSPAVKEIVGSRGFGQSAFDALMPHPIAKAAWRVLAPQEKDAAYANAVFTAMAASEYHGSAPGPNASAADKTAWINRIKNNARSTFIIKGLLGLISPLAPQVSNEDPGMRDEFYKLVGSEGYNKALADFLEKHGTKAISYTVAHSHSTVSGAFLPYTNQALTYINSPEGQQLIHSPLATGAAFLIPQAQGKGDVQVVHSELIRNGLRSVDTPQQFLDAIDLAMGNNAIQPAWAEHKQILADAGNAGGLVSAENRRWSDYVQAMGVNNATWYNYWQSPERTQNATTAWSQLKTIFETPGLAPKTNQASVVEGLMEDYNHHALTMAQTTNAGQRKIEKEKWSTYLDHTATTNPLAFSVINAVFSRLDAALTPSGTTISAGSI